MWKFALIFNKWQITHIEGPVISMYNSRVGLNQRWSFSIVQSWVHIIEHLKSHVIPSLGKSDSGDPDVADSWDSPLGSLLRDWAGKFWLKSKGAVYHPVYHIWTGSPVSAYSLLKPRLPFQCARHSAFWLVHSLIRPNRFALDLNHFTVSHILPH